MSSSALSDSILLSSSHVLSFLQSTSSYVNEQLSGAIHNVTKTKSTSNQEETFTGRRGSAAADCCPWSSLPLDLAALIASYLTPHELCTFAQVDKFSMLTFHQLAKESSGYWRRELGRSFAPAMISPQIHSLSLLNYFQCNLLEAQIEFRHYQSLANHYNAIFEYHQSLHHSPSSFLRHYSSLSPQTESGILGLVCDIAWTDSPLLSAVLSKKRYMTMSTILTRSVGDVHKFKKAVNCDRIRSFLPVRSAAPAIVDADLLRVQANDLLFPGFIGFAVNLLRLPKTLEHLRFTVFWGLFRDLMVFDNRTSSQLYGSTLSPEEMEKYWVVTLEDYSEEVLQGVFPRLGVKKQRECYSERGEAEMLRQLGSRVENGVISYSIARCTY